MLLRNYYSSLTCSMVGNHNVTEDVASDLSPRFSRVVDTAGNYRLATFPSYILDSSYSFDFAYGLYASGLKFITFGDSTDAVTFNDYKAHSSSGNGDITAIRTSTETTYNENTKTYTLFEKYTLTNNQSFDMVINEILLGGAGGTIASSSSSYKINITRDLLGENSFTLQQGESVKFELTVKYTIAQPLQ